MGAERHCTRWWRRELSPGSGTLESEADDDEGGRGVAKKAKKTTVVYEHGTGGAIRTLVASADDIVVHDEHGVRIDSFGEAVSSIWIPMHRIVTVTEDR